MTASSLGPSESHVGEIGSNVVKFQAQIGPSSTTSFSAGMCMSAPIEITNAGRVAGGTGMLMGASLLLNIANVVPIDLIVFSAQPGGTYAANAAFTLAAADFTRISKTFHVTDLTPVGAAVTMCEALSSPKFYKCDDAAKTQSLWVVPVARGNITLAAASDATLTLRLSRN